MVTFTKTELDTFFEQTYSYKNKLFESICDSHLIECTTEELYIQFKSNKENILSDNKTNCDIGINNVLAFFNKTKSFETKNDKNDKIKPFLTELLDVYLKCGDDNFTRDELKKCLLYFLPVLNKENLGISRTDLKGLSGDFKTNYWSIAKGDYKKSLELFLNNFFECKFKVPSDVSKDEKNMIHSDFKRVQKDMLNNQR